MRERRKRRDNRCRATWSDSDCTGAAGLPMRVNNRLIDCTFVDAEEIAADSWTTRRRGTDGGTESGKRMEREKEWKTAERPHLAVFERVRTISLGTKGRASDLSREIYSFIHREGSSSDSRERERERERDIRLSDDPFVRQSLSRLGFRIRARSRMPLSRPSARSARRSGVGHFEKRSFLSRAIL